MDSLLKFLLNLLNIATVCRCRHVIVLPPEDLLAVTLAGSPLAQESKRIGHIISAVASDHMSMAVGLERLLEMAQQLKAGRGLLAPLDEHWDAAAAALNQLLMVNALLEYPCALHSSLTFDDRAMFDLIQLLAIEPTAGSPETVLAARVASYSGEIQISRETELLRRIIITYRRDTAYPALTVKLPSTTLDASRQGTRVNWEQRDTPSDDLALYNFNHRPLGQIITRRVRAPYEIKGHKLTLRFSPQSGIEFLVTDVIDTRDTVLGRCVKFV